MPVDPVAYAQSFHAVPALPAPPVYDRARPLTLMDVPCVVAGCAAVFLTEGERAAHAAVVHQRPVPPDALARAYAWCTRGVLPHAALPEEPHAEP